jgi:hypothetical protein
MRTCARGMAVNHVVVQVIFREIRGIMVQCLKSMSSQMRIQLEDCECEFGRKTTCASPSMAVRHLPLSEGLSEGICYFARVALWLGKVCRVWLCKRKARAPDASCD